MTGYNNFFDLKELQKKKSSLLNVSNGSSKSKEFNLNDIGVLVDSKEHNWFKRAQVRKFLGIARIITSNGKLLKKDKKSRTFSQAEGGCHNVKPTRQGTQDHDIFLSKASVLYVLNKCRKSTNTLKKLADYVGVELHKNKKLFKEQKPLQNIMDVFKGEEMLTQFSVGGYKIDLYFPRHKLAVEVRRQKYIENKLGCQFIRFNPDARDFNIFEVANRIFSSTSKIDHSNPLKM